MTASPFPILYEDNHLLVIDKPAGMVTMGIHDDSQSALAVAKSYVKARYHKPGRVYLGVVSRLDAPVTGVLVFARTSKAAARLNEQFRSRAVHKTYWALVEGRVGPSEGLLIDYLAKDERHRRMHAVPPHEPGAQEARLGYRRRAQWRDVAWLEIELQTGRKHQIRVQCARWGHPIVGDRKYGSRLRFDGGIALHARRLEIRHPVQERTLELIAPLPAAWRKWGDFASS